MISTRDEKTSVHTFRKRSKDAAVVFVHGFSGDARKTWGQFPEFFLHTDGLADWDVFSFGYSTSLMPDIRGIWSAEPPLVSLADLFRTTLGHSPFDKYKALALVAHSMGGLIVQRALLDDGLKDKTTHVILFGTPSAGLVKSSFISFWKRQFRDIAAQSPFITDLRSRWANVFADEPPFAFHTVAGDKDEFVPRRSSIEPFPEKYRVVVPGDHLEIVKPSTEKSLSFQLVFKALTGDSSPAGLWNSARVAVEMRDFRKAVRLLEPHKEQLDENGLVQLALALEGTGRQEDAITLLKKIRKGQTDAMGTLAGRLKRRWYAEHRKADIEKADELYRRAYAIAVKKKKPDHDQAFYHGINIAFLELAYRKRPRAARSMAERVIDHCKKIKQPDKWCAATLGEANLILGHTTKGLEHYSKAIRLGAQPREIDSMYQQASRIGALLGDRGLLSDIENLFKEGAK